MMKKGLLAVAATAAVFSMPALAADNPFASDKAVLHLSDLDLSTVDGQQRLASRMDAAARSVCGDRLASVHLAMAERSRECRQSVIADIRTLIESRPAMASADAPAHLASAR